MWFIDTETFLFGPGRGAPRVVCIQVQRDAEPPALYHARDVKTEKIIADILADADGVVGHNIAYDFACIAATWPDLIPAIWSKYDRELVCDTMIAQQILDIGAEGALRRKYDLATMVGRFLGGTLAKGDDTWRLRYGELDAVPLSEWPAKAIEYALLDVSMTASVWRGVAHEGIGHTTEHQVRAAFALHLATVWGMRCDPVAVAALADSLASSTLAQQPTLIHHGILRANGTVDTKRVRELVVESGGTALTPTSVIKIDADALRASGDSRLLSLLAYRETQKLRSTYLPVLEQGAKTRVHPRYRVAVESGRTSCSGPNIQNLPRAGGVRECFVPTPGYVFVSADYGMAELVCLAQVTSMLTPPSRMLSEILDGRELHIVTAANILGTSYDDTERAYRAKDPRVVDARQLAKGLNFGIPGGLGPATLANLLLGYGITVTANRAKELREQWLALYPEVVRYFDMLGAASQPMTISHPSTGFRRAGMYFCAAANFHFQHLGAYGGKEAVYAVQRACFHEGPLLGCRLVAFIHDELIVEAPEGAEHEAAQELRRIMVREFSKATPDVTITVDVHAMRRWSKDAKPVYDADSRLIPWGT